MTLYREYKLALREIGPIVPWWVEDDQLFYFEHTAYPAVDGGGTTEDAAIAQYHRALKRFITARMQGQVADFVDKMTTGRGGVRPGSGRPKNSEASRRVSVPASLAEDILWLKGHPEYWDQFRALKQQSQG